MILRSARRISLRLRGTVSQIWADPANSTIRAARLTLDGLPMIEQASEEPWLAGDAPSAPQVLWLSPGKALAAWQDTNSPQNQSDILAQFLTW